MSHEQRQRLYAFRPAKRLEAEVFRDARAQNRLVFVSEELATSNIQSFRPNRPDGAPAGIEIALITSDVAAAVEQAIAAGATPLTDPEEKPWGQVVAYVRDPNGVLVELGSDVH